MPRLSKTVYTKRQTNLSWAVCSTLMCICFPIGLIAVLVALKSGRAWKDDRPETAGDLADMAKTLALIAILCSIISICIFVALLASGYFYQVLYNLGLMRKETMDVLVVAQGEDAVEPPKEKEPEYEYYYYYETIEVPIDNDDTATKKVSQE
ncbi:uncharacterized protein [Watersipora subatra]|uniref:uncharacterized protein n=1 Tax=Watersipora subatra TaxID=2589382 RepID=UPI00355C8A4D